MEHNKKNILFKFFAKHLRFLKELRTSYDPNLYGKFQLSIKSKKELALIYGIGDAMNFVRGHYVDIRALYPLKYSVSGVRKHRMRRAFIDFLHEKGAYVNYMKYRGIRRSCKIVLHEQVMRWLDVCGFYWSETEEGYFFWENISNAWKDFCITTPIMDDRDEIRDCVQF